MNFWDALWQWVGTGVNKLEVKEWIALIGVVAGFVTFWMKLRTDSRAARYRETIAFIDKNTKSIAEDFAKIESAHSQGSLDLGAAKQLCGLLDTTALLIKKQAFDGELIYNYWWNYVTTPMDFPEVKIWINKLRDDDKAICVHYCELQAKWKKRVERERKKGLTKFKLGASNPSKRP